MDKPKNKLWENQEWLATELQTKTTRTVAKEQKVSYKLINVWALRFGLIRRTPELELA